MKRWACLMVAVFLLVPVHATALAGELPSPAETPIARALAQKIDLDLQNTSLDNVLKYIAEATKGLRIDVDPSIAVEGTDLSSRTVTLKEKGLSVQTVLEVVLGADLGYRVEPHRLLVTTRKRLLANLSTLSYVMAGIQGHLATDERLNEKVFPFDDDEARPSAKSAGPDRAMRRVLRLVFKAVEEYKDLSVAPWGDGQGGARAWYQEGMLTVTQTSRGQERVKALLAQLAEALARPEADLQQTLALAPKQPVIEEADAGERAETRRRLAEEIDLDLEKTSLDNVLKYISEVRRGLNLVVDPGVAGTGIDLSTRVVNVKARRVSVESVLALILSPDLGFRIARGYVLIATKQELQQSLPLKVCPVADLVKTAALASGTRKDMAAMWREFTEAVEHAVSNQSHYDVAAWDVEGGPAFCDALGGVLVVAQTEQGHERVLDLLDRIRRALASKPGEVSLEPAAVTAVRKRLAEKIDCDFENTTLDNVLQYISEVQRGLNIFIDPGIAASGIDLSTRVVNLKANQATVASVLDRIVREDLAYAVKEGYIIVTTRERQLGCLDLDVYPVQDVLPAAQAGKPASWVLADSLRAAVSNKADPKVAMWEEQGGRAVAELLGGAVIVTQTPRGHEKVVEYLRKLREQRAEPSVRP
jgi:hypothetical protein